MKVLLVQPSLNPNVIGAGLLYLNEPLALETLAATIPHHEVKILDMRIEPKLEEELNSFQPEIVGVTAYTPDVYIASDILKKVKDWHPEVLTVIGGQHATLLPEDFNKEFIDVIVIGEGEYSFQELVDTYQTRNSLRNINGLALHENGSLFLTQARKLNMDLNSTPFPVRSLTKRYRDKYFRVPWRPVASIMTSRGCPFRCNFCSVWKREEGKYRTQSPERVVNELMSIGEKCISIADDNFLQDTKRAEKIYDLIKEKGIKKVYKLIGRSDTIMRHPSLIEKWKEIGMEMMVIGLESFRDEELKKLNKTTTIKDNEEAIHILHQNGVKVAGQFIIHPDYTKEDFDALYDYVEKMNLLHPTFSVLTPLPGTDLFEEKKEQLLTRNYELFDLVHSVLPTKLPRKEFYKYYADLCKKSYLSTKGEFVSQILPESTLIDIYFRILNAWEL